MSATAQAVNCGCGRRFQASAQLAGRRVQCPGCGQPIDVPPLSDPLPAAGLAMQTLPAANPLGRPAPHASQPPSERRKLPLGAWIGLGVGGAALVVVLVVVFSFWMKVRRLLAENRAQAAQRIEAGQAAPPQAGPQRYQSPTGRFGVEFPGRPRQELIRSTEPGGLSHWQAQFTTGEFSKGRGEQFLAIEQPLAGLPTEEKIARMLTSLTEITAGVDTGRGRILSSIDLQQPGYQGREITYENQSQQGIRTSGRYRVLISQREAISIEWVAAPAKAETPEVQRFFDSFQLIPRQAGGAP